MKKLGFKSCKGDPDVWMREGTKTSGEKYWILVLLDVDDVLCIAEEGIGGSILNDEIGKYFPFKTGSVGPPDIYLGGKLKKVDVGNGAWA